MAVEHCEYHCFDRPIRGFWQRLGFLLQRLGRQIERWDQLAQQRQQLREMDEWQLKDIGLSRADVERIAGRRFWDDPVARDISLDDRYRRGSE